jgi:hypothetical protein
VDDACQNFASSTIQHTPSTSFAPLPHAPISRPPSQARTTRPNRVPRKVLSASQIFANDADDTTTATANSNHHDDSMLLAPHWSDGRTLNPKAARRATVSALSPERFIDPENLGLHAGSTKSKSQGDLFQTQIAPIAALELELARGALSDLRYFQLTKLIFILQKPHALQWPGSLSLLGANRSTPRLRRRPTSNQPFIKRSLLTAQPTSHLSLPSAPQVAVSPNATSIHC